MHLTIKNGRRTPGGACDLIMGSNTCAGLMKSPQIGGFVEGQHEIKSPAWSGKTTNGLLASPLDCHKTTKIMSYEDAALSPTHKRTEGRAPVRGSEFTSKDAALLGGIQQKPL